MGMMEFGAPGGGATFSRQSRAGMRGVRMWGHEDGDIPLALGTGGAFPGRGGASSGPGEGGGGGGNC
eukprot:8583312-Pyramimonas_sp.AAC.1